MKVKNRTSAIAPTDPLVFLAGGDILVIRSEAIDDESLTGRWVHFPAWPAVKVPLDVVRGLLLNRPAALAVGARLFNQVLEYRDLQDAIIMVNGDTARRGVSFGLDDKLLCRCKLRWEKPAIDRSGIRAMVFNPALSNNEPLKGDAALISLVDGSRFRARDLKFGVLERLSLRTRPSESSSNYPSQRSNRFGFLAAARLISQT